MVSFLGFRPTGAGPRLRRDMARLTDELQRRGATGPASPVDLTPAGDGEMSALAALLRFGVVVEVRPGAYYYDPVAGERRRDAQLGCGKFFLIVFGAIGLVFALAAAFLLWSFMSR